MFPTSRHENKFYLNYFNFFFFFTLAFLSFFFFYHNTQYWYAFWSLKQTKSTGNKESNLKQDLKKLTSHIWTICHHAFMQVKSNHHIYPVKIQFKLNMALTTDSNHSNLGYKMVLILTYLLLNAQFIFSNALK